MKSKCHKIMKPGDIIYFHDDFYINNTICYKVGLYEIVEWGSLFITLRRIDDGTNDVIRELNNNIRIRSYFFTLNEYREFKISPLID